MTDRYQELARRAGLFLDDVGRRSLQRVDLESATALEQAAEILAVPETWFFRDSEPFVYLAKFAACAPRPLRVLSAPCATGEEPYSIAMALLEAGLMPGEFAIDAVDISAQAIAAAQCAVYGKASFRQAMPELTGKYFEPAGQGYRLREQVSSHVRFRQANLLDGLEAAPTYHAIFCRNLLIYLHEEARKAVIAILRSRLSGDGVLFAGHSEVSLFLDAGFRKVEHPRSFACLPAPWEERSPAVAVPVRVAAVRERPPAPAKRPAASPPASPPPPAEPGLEDARSLADRGRLGEAAAICRRLGPSAEGFCLQGLISQSSDRLAEAEEYFRRALYLDPGHCESLVHMSLLCASRGDAERSAAFRERARRFGNSPARMEAR